MNGDLSHHRTNSAKTFVRPALDECITMPEHVFGGLLVIQPDCHRRIGNLMITTEGSVLLNEISITEQQQNDGINCNYLDCQGNWITNLFCNGDRCI